MESTLFEIHVTVDERDDVYAFRMWCAERKYKPIHAVAKHARPQLMMSKYKNGTAGECVAYAKGIADDLRKCGLRPVRTKVEAATPTSWVGTPKHPDLTIGSSNYFEWHLKYPAEHAKALELFAECSPVVFVSYNQLKKEMEPLLTIRIAGLYGLAEATRLKDEIIEGVKKNGIHTNEGIKFEYAVYDDNMGLDEIFTTHDGNNRDQS